MPIEPLKIDHKVKRQLIDGVSKSCNVFLKIDRFYEMGKNNFKYIKIALASFLI